ncbi:MAG: cell division protein FtsA [Verrucomicrobia bacterium RIFCSPLOWO2_12_FULL_64_8]|nr:MAG: cell division protein FtsA [Verrucomicrobia bacterium RIFCSPLOWO2_12_FULL_64_8]
MTPRTKIIGAVEIGTAKITVLVGELARGRTLNIIGLGTCQSHGVIKGSVVDYRAASDAAHTAFKAAEERAGVPIECVYLAQSGAHLEGFYNEAAVSVTAADNCVSEVDIDTVCRLAKAKELPAGRAVVHHIRRPFRLDGRTVPAPMHLVGRRLEAGYWTVHGNEAKIGDHLHVVTGFNLRVEELILSSLASGVMVASPEERQNGVLVLDIGCGTTDFALYRDGVAQLTGVVAVGGDHLTNDLSLGLRLTRHHAEKIKLRYGSAMVRTRDKHDKVWLNGDYSVGDRQFPRNSIEQITAARAWELLEVVKKKLGPAFAPEQTPAGVMLTGGGAKLPGIDEAAGRVFGAPARLGEAPGWVADELRDPGFSTALGLLYYGLSSQADSSPATRRSGGLLENLKRILIPA